MLATKDIFYKIWKVGMKQQPYLYALKVGILCQVLRHLLAHLVGLRQHLTLRLC